MSYESKHAIDVHAAAVAISGILDMPHADVEALGRCIARMSKDAHEFTLGELLALLELIRRD